MAYPIVLEYNCRNSYISFALQSSNIKYQNIGPTKSGQTFGVEECEGKEESNQLLDTPKCSLSTLLF